MARSASGSGFTAATEQGTLQGLVQFVDYRDQVFQILAFTAQPRWSAYGMETPPERSGSGFGAFSSSGQTSPPCGVKRTDDCGPNAGRI